MIFALQIKKREPTYMIFSPPALRFETHIKLPFLIANTQELSNHEIVINWGVSTDNVR